MRVLGLLTSQIFKKKINTLNVDQKNVFEAVTKAVEHKSYQQYIFLDGPGGSGKTYLYSTLISYLRSIEKAVIAIAWTGIAATLLEGGRTVHSMFKLPVPLLQSSSCDLRLFSPQALQIKEADIIIWDEVTMASCYALDAIDRFLRDLMDSQVPFGGKVVVLSGDFRQCLPVVKHGSKTEILEQCIKRSLLWPLFNYMKLSINQRLNDDGSEFSQWLLQLGDGELNEHTVFGNDCVKIPKELFSITSLADDIFGKSFSLEDVDNIKHRVILAPTNDNVQSINEDILKRLEGESKCYTSVDSIICDHPEEEMNYPTEFLNSLTPSGMPPHRLLLKVGAIVMLLRNLNTLRGLCNGSRLVIEKLGENVLFCKLLSGSKEGDVSLIPRIFLRSSAADLPFGFSRLQFPIKLAYAMTINKAQGQTLEHVGIVLPRPVFTHGQLYVAFSRCRKKENIRVCITESKEQGRTKDGVYTKNVVYKEVFE